MKLVLEFDIPEDQYNAWCAANALKVYGAITEIQQELRANRKYDKDASKTLAAIQETIVELHNEIGEPI